MRRKILFVSLFLIGFLSFQSHNAKAQNGGDPPPPSLNKLWHTREHFVYSVKYSFFHLGTITLDVMPDTMYHGKKCRYIQAVGRSNPGLPFIGDEIDYFSSFTARNDTMLYDMYYWKDDIDKGVKKQVQYRLNYKKKKVFIYNKEDKKRDTLALDKPSFCGLAFFFYPRMFAGTNHHIKVPVYVNYENSYITLNNTTKEDDLDIQAFPGGHVMAYKSTGDAHFDGPLGFRGAYTAWYADDAMRIPVQAYVHVWLGNVKIRLIKYSIIK